MTGRVLHEARLIAEAVEAVIAQAMKVTLMVAVAACGKLTVLIESELKISRRNGLVLCEATATSGEVVLRCSDDCTFIGICSPGSG